ncbi:MAG TPA: crosslink repair DNA glycosylase YcaQ family protein [Vicinamibacterales bacterium]|nr:crosslink repair DNA glycosylase YcaQ family protein [Vicinamibacterales bacterium]
MRARPEIPAEIEEYRDVRWRREGTRQVETALDAERFIEEVGFTACLTDSRRPGPSLYVAVCGRRDAVMPRNVQKDTEASLTWLLKDELVRRGKVYYAKLARGKAMFLAPRMIPAFHAIWGVRRSEENRLSQDARAILEVLRREWEMSTSDLREASGVKDRKACTSALNELQAAMIVVPSEVCYLPKFTYIWTLGVGRFPDSLRRRVSRESALREVARCFLAGAGLTIPGELARVAGLSRPDAGRGNRALVAEGYANRLGPGMYQLAAGGGLPRLFTADRPGPRTPRRPSV